MNDSKELIAVLGSHVLIPLVLMTHFSGFHDIDPQRQVLQVDKQNTYPLNVFLLS
jgi:hypothetical protein